jgi:thiol-disulfide isomerase/thioredoxin
MPHFVHAASITSFITSVLGVIAVLPGVEPGQAQVSEAQPPVDAEAYADADWPAHNKNLYAKDLQGQPLPVKLGEEQWLTEKQKLDGKVLVLDFWATWCGPCIAANPKLEKLHKQYLDDLSVVAISGQREDVSTVQSFLEDKRTIYPHLHDDEQRVFKPFESRGIPLVVVLSTDGVVRWMGNPHQKEFQEAVDQVLRADPLVRARSKG